MSSTPVKHQRPTRIDRVRRVVMLLLLLRLGSASTKPSSMTSASITWPSHALSGCKQKGTPRSRIWFSGSTTAAMPLERSPSFRGLLSRDSFPRIKIHAGLANTLGKRSLSCVCYGLVCAWRQPLPASGLIRRRRPFCSTTHQKDVCGALASELPRTAGKVSM